jgi:tripartite-type tricarboxylate transporter receptor subunit TctC
MKYRINRSGAHALIAGIALCGLVPQSLAQRKPDGTAPYPNRPVRAIVPYAPGGGTDILARTLAQKLSALWNQQVVIDNRGGGATIVGTDLAAKAPRDGYTLLITSTSFAINPSVQPKLPYSTLADLDPVTQIAFQPYVLVLHPAVAARDVKDFVALSKARPNAISFGSTGTGSGAHLAGELFKLTSGASMTHVPYKGMGPALADLLGGQTQAVFGTILPTLPHVKSGRLRALGVTSTKRSSAMPDLPTIAERGVPGFSATSWTALYTPAGVPRTVLAKLNTDTRRVLQTAEMREKLAADGAEPAGGSPEELAAFLRQEISKWSKVIKAANIQIQ